MSSEIVRIVSSGCFVTYILRLENGESGRLYTGNGFRNYSNWKGLKVGDRIEGLRWKSEEKRILDADSFIKVLVRE